MRTWRFTVGTTLLVGIAYTCLIRLPDLRSDTVTSISNWCQLAAATAGAAGCGWAARRSRGRLRRVWTWLAVGVGSWAAGQAVWTYYEEFAGRSVPFPSLADVGFLGFPLAAGWGMVLWLAAPGAGRAARGRDILDAAIIAGSLFALSWVTALGSVVGQGTGDGWWPFALSLAYPVGDVVMATLAIMSISRSRAPDRVPLAILTLGLVAVSAADSSFLYLDSLSAFSSTQVIPNLGWTLGFLLIGAAGLSVQRSAAATPVTAEDMAAPTSRLRLALPYVPLVLAMGVLGTALLRGTTNQHVTPLLAGALVVMVLLRQYLVVLDNQQLLAELGTARDALQHQATHDSLTHLPNRVLFDTRLDHALRDGSSSLSVLFCDLDDFKPVNDDLGHEVGDQLLREIARRLVACVGGSGSVARLGGDEFAVLLDATADPDDIADDIVSRVADGITLDGLCVRSSISIGIAHYAGTDGEPGVVVPSAERAALAAQLLREADVSMYAAKSAHKGRTVIDVQQGPAVIRERRSPLGGRRRLTAADARAQLRLADEPEALGDLVS